jgi:hypothetical protein
MMVYFPSSLPRFVSIPEPALRFTFIIHFGCVRPEQRFAWFEGVGASREAFALAR